MDLRFHNSLGKPFRHPKTLQRNMRPSTAWSIWSLCLPDLPDLQAPFLSCFHRFAKLVRVGSKKRLLRCAARPTGFSRFANFLCQHGTVLQATPSGNGTSAATNTTAANTTVATNTSDNSSSLACHLGQDVAMGEIVKRE